MKHVSHLDPVFLNYLDQCSIGPESFGQSFKKVLSRPDLIVKPRVGKFDHFFKAYKVQLKKIHDDLKDLINALGSGEHEIDMSVFGTITSESSDPNAGNFYYYMLQIIGMYRGMAVFNNNKHTFVEVGEKDHTVSIKTEKGKMITVAIKEGAGCVDIALHNSGLEPVENGGLVPQFNIMGFNCGGTPVKKTPVTVATIMLDK